MQLSQEAGNLTGEREKKGADIYTCVTAFGSHINVMVYLSVSSIYTEGPEAQWARGCSGYDWWSTQTPASFCWSHKLSLPTCVLCFYRPTPSGLRTPLPLGGGDAWSHCSPKPSEDGRRLRVFSLLGALSQRLVWQDECLLRVRYTLRCNLHSRAFLQG